MVSNHNTSAPRGELGGTLPAWNRRVPTPPPTAAGDGLPELTAWELQDIWLPVGGANHFFPSGRTHSGCWRKEKPGEEILRTRRNGLNSYISARIPRLWPGRIMERGNDSLKTCTPCARVYRTVVGKA